MFPAESPFLAGSRHSLQALRLSLAHEAQGPATADTGGLCPPMDSPTRLFRS
jgi:hypothetical protein